MIEKQTSHLFAIIAIIAQVNGSEKSIFDHRFKKNERFNQKQNIRYE